MGKIFQNIPFLRILIPFSAGIIISDYIHNIDLKLFIIPSLFLVFVFFFFAVKTSLTSSYFSGISLSLLILAGGITVHQFRSEQPRIIDAGKYWGILLEKPEEREKSYKAELLINYAFVDDSVIRMKERIIVYFRKDSCVDSLMPGDNILIGKELQLIENKGNPLEFNYKSYLARRKIYRQVFLNTNNWEKYRQFIRPDLRIRAEKFRTRLLDIYREVNISGSEYQILAALTLGYRKAMDPEIKKVFASAGATHVLAVSGLHVGIIYIVLLTILGFLKRNKKTKLIFSGFILVILWFYATITGYSPSVLRATIMFSMLIIGENMRRPINIYNSLASSATILLLINSDWLFDPGFQLSYAAVFSIVFFQPLLSELITPKSLIGKYIWGLIAVSIASQIGTIPLILFYFGQFPVYFLITNLIIIPLAFILICLGFLVLATSFLPLIPYLLGNLTKSLVHFSFLTLENIENLPGSLIKNIHLSQVQMLLLFGAIILLMAFIRFRKSRYFKTLLICFLLITISGVYRNIHSLFQQKVIIYNSGSYPIVHLISGKNNYLISERNEFENDLFLKNTIQNLVTKTGLREPKYLHFYTEYTDERLFIKNGIICFSGKTFAVITNLSDSLPELNFDFLVLKNESQTKDSANILHDIPIVSYYKEFNFNNLYSVYNSGAWILNF